MKIRVRAPPVAGVVQVQRVARHVLGRGDHILPKAMRRLGDRRYGAVLFQLSQETRYVPNERDHRAGRRGA